MSIIRDLKEAVRRLHGETTIALDLETSGFSPYKDQIAVVAIKGQQTPPCILHIRGSMPDELRRFLRDYNGTVITHNGTCFDLLFLRKYDITFRNHFDTLIAEQVLLVAGRRDHKKNLGATIKRRLQREVKIEGIDHGGWMNPELTDEQLEYVEADIIALHALRAAQIKLAYSRGLGEAIRKEMELSPLVVEISYNGLAISIDKMMKLQLQAVFDAAQAKERLNNSFGILNVNSAKQVRAALESVGATVPNTQAKTLEKMSRNFPEAGDIVKVRQSNRKVGVYDPAWIDEHVHDGRVHTQYWQVGTDTTRFTSTNPNLQQIPRAMRSMIGNTPDHSIVSCDFAQIEIRLAAFIAGDDDLVRALEAEDFHTDMAKTMFNKDEVTHAERRDGKAGTFTWLFAGGANGVVEAAATAGIDIDPSDAARMVGALRRRFTTTNRFHNRCRAKCRGARVISLDLKWGHKRQLVGESNISPQKIVNTLVQSRAAIGLKESIFELQKNGVIGFVGGLVHDEIVASNVPDAQAEEVSHLIRKSMIDGMTKVCDTVPILVDTDITYNWVP